MANNDGIKTLSNEILTSNKMLYCMHKQPMTVTCMCWGLEVPDSWLNHVDVLSKKLEAMNIMTYPKHRVRIQADQVKSKFSMLAYYYSVVADPPRWVCSYEKGVSMLMRLIECLDFKLKKVLDQPEYDEVVEEHLEDGISFDDASKKYKNITNVKIIAKDNAIVKRTTYHHYAQYRYEPTRFKLLHMLYAKRHMIMNLMRTIIRWEPTDEQMCIKEMLDAYAQAAIATAKDECSHTCENCGRRIDTSYSPACITHGWISRLCDECADKQDALYTKNNEVWKNGKIIIDANGKRVDEAKPENEA